jgi:hypothetical protein
MSQKSNSSWLKFKLTYSIRNLLKTTIATTLDQEGKIEFYEEKEKDTSAAKSNMEANSIHKLPPDVPNQKKNQLVPYVHTKINGDIK